MSPRTRADDGEVDVFKFGTEGINSLSRFVLLGDVSRGYYSRIWMLLPQFVKQMCPSAYDANAVALCGIFLEECSANARGGSNDDDVFFIHFYVSFRIRIVFWKLFFPNQLFPYSFGYRKHSGKLLIIFLQQCR